MAVTKTWTQLVPPSKSLDYSLLQKTKFLSFSLPPTPRQGQMHSCHGYLGQLQWPRITPQLLDRLVFCSGASYKPSHFSGTCVTASSWCHCCSWSRWACPRFRVLPYCVEEQASCSSVLDLLLNASCDLECLPSTSWVLFYMLYYSLLNLLPQQPCTVQSLSRLQVRKQAGYVGAMHL